MKAGMDICCNFLVNIVKKYLETKGPTITMLTNTKGKLIAIYVVKRCQLFQI